ncbi:MAG: hypothetical protein DLM60_10670 [Pseudonocardiales bacterium]|nr:MAG: hypothetical protein DLM60_10670 [Pseudonocardiales bacterium]
MTLGERRTLLFVCDLDGTLLDRDGHWPKDELDDLAQEVTRAGFRAEFWLATGRSPHDCVRLLTNGPKCMETVRAICFDGALEVIIRQGRVVETLSETLLGPKVIVGPAFKILRRCVGVKGDFLVFSDTRAGSKVFIYSSIDEPPFCQLAQAAEDPRPVEIVPTLGDLHRAAASVGVRAVSWFGKRTQLPSEKDDVMVRAKKAFSCLLYPEVRFPGLLQGFAWLDLVHPKVSKGSMVASSLGGRNDFTIIGLGNGTNDLSYLQIAEVAICPSDAEPEVKGIVDLVLPSPAGPEFVSSVWSAARDRIPPAQPLYKAPKTGVQQS